MSDQADGLRQRIRLRPEAASVAGSAPGSQARILVFTGGKGGVGTSNLTLNLAIALGQAGKRVVLVDADWGLANLDLLCGLAPRCDLGDVLAADRPLTDAIMDGPGGIRFVAGAHGLRTSEAALATGPDQLAASLADLRRDADFVLIDAGCGLDPGLMTLAAVADEMVLVTTPEPTALADTHAVLRRISSIPGVATGRPLLRVVVTQAETRLDASDGIARITAASREFLGLVVRPLGHVRSDVRVRKAVRLRQPFVVSFPHGQAARCVGRIARKLIGEQAPGRARSSLAVTLSAHWPLCRVVHRME